MTTAYNGRIYESVTSRGYGFEILWNGQIRLDRLDRPVRSYSTKETSVRD